VMRYIILIISIYPLSNSVRFVPIRQVPCLY